MMMYLRLAELKLKTLYFVLKRVHIASFADC